MKAMDPAVQPLAAFAAATPDKAAVVMNTSGLTRTYREVDEASTRLARVLRDRGVKRGDHVAVLLDNHPEFYDVVWGAMRLGASVTPSNWHLVAAEAGYIVRDCEATAIFVSSRLAPLIAEMQTAGDLDRVTTRVSVDGPLAGFDTLADLVAGVDASELDDQSEGGWMFYSSGTTGKPKGILPPLQEGEIGAKSFLTMMLGGMFAFTPETVWLRALALNTNPESWSNPQAAHDLARSRPTQPVEPLKAAS